MTEEVPYKPVTYETRFGLLNDDDRSRYYSLYRVGVVDGIVNLEDYRPIGHLIGGAFAQSMEEAATQLVESLKDAIEAVESRKWIGGTATQHWEELE